MDPKTIKSIAEEVKPLYRHLHAHPEISGEEKETARFLREKLSAMGYDITVYDNFGLHCDLKGERSGPTVAVRADMDALPITEATSLPFRSENPGLMHACGHDMHMACLLGTALYFSNHRHFPGTLRLIFQPNEEKDGGAEIMVKEGVMEGVDYVIGLHVAPELLTGTFGILPGFMYASVEDFKITLRGVGGHAAHPEDCIDPIVCGGHVIVALQSIVSRRFSPFTPAVVTIGSVHGGNKHNIIPGEMTIEGTIRADTKENRDKLRRWLTEITELTAKAHGCVSTVEIIKGYVPLINDEKTTATVKKVLEETFGEDAVITLPTPTMGAEDFAYYLEEAPGTFLNLGVGRPRETSAIHTATFYPEEDALYYGIYAEVASALHFMNES